MFAATINLTRSVVSPLQLNCSKGAGWDSCQNGGHVDGPLSFFRGVCAYSLTAVCAPICSNHFQIAFLQEPDTCVAGRVSPSKILRMAFGFLEVCNYWPITI